MTKKLSPVDKFYENLPQYKEELEKLLDPNVKRRGRKRKNKMYFTPINEKAIVAYNKEKSEAKRNKIYAEHIHYPIWKLSQNIINRFKFPYMDGTTEDKQYEVIAFLLQKLNKYTENKGRAFSYFSIVAKNYCIQTNNKAYKMLKSKTNLLAVDRQRNITNEMVTTERQQSLKDFMDIFIETYDEEVDGRFNKQSDKKIAYAVLELFRRRENIEKYNKKALYVLIREMTNEKTQDISKIVNIIKKEFKERLIEYENIKLDDTAR
tara:strand:+ start:267 stop:1058 length:792 start_codon:yes stop_codon:yes gene_type:complete